MNDNNPQPNEPSVLDYVKSKLSFGRRPKVEIPESHEAESKTESVAPQFIETEAVRPAVVKRQPSTPFPWLSLIALGLALLAQRMFEPQPSVMTGIALYLMAFAFLLWSVLRGEWKLLSLAESSAGNDPLTFHLIAFLISIPFAVLAFFFFSGNLFTYFNLTLWLIALILFVGALWLRDPSQPSWWQRAVGFVSRREWQIHITRWMLLIVAFSVVVIFFRVYHIQQTPSEPFSDHAEKALDIFDILSGQPHIFFPRNTGREAIGMYWIVAIVGLFQMGISFLTMKIATISMGLFTLPYIYLLGKEIANRRVGLLAFFMAGIAYWPNVISRIGLRFPLYPLFLAPMMLYLIRGLRTRNRNDFILSGIFLGLGLNGYTPYRIVPFLVAAAIILYMLHAQSKGARKDALIWFVIIGLTSFVIFIPLFRYVIENPDMFSYRAFSRLGTGESLPAPWYQIFASNLWVGLKMFNLDDGNIWVNSLPHYPALDIVSGALFLIGVVLVLVRYVQKRHWLDLFLLLSIPILQLPSTLSLAFPDENPALNRAGGAYIPVFIIVALALDSFIAAFGSEKRRKVVAWILTAVLLFWSAAQNYDLVFNQFDQQYRQSAWNSSEMGAVIQQFGSVYGETDTVWIVPFPYWVDTRLPGVWAGIPNRDFAMFPDHLSDTVQLPGTKLFIVKANLQDPTANDQKSLDILKQLYPKGALSLHRSPVAGDDFWIYFVPSQQPNS
ncbi:MAG TPA: glycosyltransferase family 39 protein [Anaerolineales bacterium]